MDRELHPAFVAKHNYRIPPVARCRQVEIAIVIKIGATHRCQSAIPHTRIEDAGRSEDRVRGSSRATLIPGTQSRDLAFRAFASIGHKRITLREMVWLSTPRASSAEPRCHHQARAQDH